MRRHPLPGPTPRLIAAAAGATLLVGAAACGDDSGGAAGSSDRPTIVVTTSVLGDVVSEIVGDDATVDVVMPAGADPHEFQPSARQAAEIREADLLVTNGGGFEAGLDSTIDSAEDDGVAVFAALDHVDPLSSGAAGDDDHADDDHAEDDDHADDDEHADDEDEHAQDDEDADDEDEHAEDDDHDHGDVDPHFFTDPARMAEAAEALADTLVAEMPALDTPDLQERADAYAAELRALDADVEDTLAAVPDDRRVLVTTHDVFAYFADRYDFELLGSVLPSLTTEGSPSAADLDALARAMEDAGVPAVFADASASANLADALADEIGDVEVVELSTESLGDSGSGTDTYVGMVRTNADRIATALA